MAVRKGTHSNIRSQLGDLCRVLESLSYVVADPKTAPVCSVDAEHPRSPKIVVLLFADAVRVETFWPCTGLAKSDREGFLSFLNRLNEEISQVTCLATQYAPDFIRIRAQLPAPYSRFPFLCFMRSWMHDLEAILRIVRTQGRGFFEGEDHPRPDSVRANGRQAERQPATNGEAGRSKER